MYLRDRAVLITAVVIVLLTIASLVVIGGSIIAASDNSPFERDEAAAYLLDVHDNEMALLVTGGAGIAVDGFFAPALAALLFVLFRDRSRTLATVAFAALITQSAISLITDGNNILLTIIASDYAAGNADALEVGRYVGMLIALLTNLLFTSLGLGLLALGMLVARSPDGAVNPPRWIGWAAIVAGVCCELTWLVFVTEAALVFFMAAYAGMMAFLIGLAGWLFAHRELEPA